tara:strand:- start:1238 stop:1630 length:393 start_codon:yes stop_codon:yes gene_type:complete
MGILRKTPFLNVLLKEFENNLNAISAVELIRRLNNKMNKTTIYRILDKLEDDGILHCFYGNKGLRWYVKCDGCCQNDPESDEVNLRPHFQCLKCGKINRLVMDIKIPGIDKKRIKASHLMIQGKCELCYG